MGGQSQRLGKNKERMGVYCKGLSRAVESSYYKSEGKQIPIKWSAPVCFL